MSDAVNHPKHYTSDPSGVECITITRHRSFNIGNAIKYLWRAGLKPLSSGPTVTVAEAEMMGAEVQDLNKAIWYICDEIGRLGGKATVEHEALFPRAFELDLSGTITSSEDTAKVGAIEGVLLGAFGVTHFEEIQLKFVDHIPNAEVVIPLMRAMGGPWAALLLGMEAFTAEQKAKATGAGVGAAYVKEAEKAVERA